ncbi:hypothetical protein ERO13_A10G238600v2 [Gossypium hirsutum]|uniref:Uncharacterized protein n=3 Tax=Gossypium TaxID=3633 RepID=A0A5J5UC10_GOSBA|nr:DNA-directed RNA polymerase III subunit 2-like isoform X2 [Gossypium hirsutum]KAB2064046.1 hypothetical protein ES319_A10G262800v1 [Gossypium barbadense]TYI08308.1 hypothetical protein ES332_A10G290300v1 [Gossypium tomentosum]KAB2064048.1 hypothetical protein ES319_A10G262800v1 [Gossypium barbadense]KAB2064050.1 hypothetical protein ES319_A10G262800v1 [Gossypium barbadense]KAB2064051.1 hypothetical protein ES319_A10G262800v1 [Gossypium barbadense]
MYRKKEFSFFLWKTHQLNVSELPVDKQKLTAPIKSTADKFQLLPEFLKVRGLMKQQLDSFDYFVNTGIKKIVRVNDRIVSDIDPSIYLRFKDARIGYPSKMVDGKLGINMLLIL